MERKAFFDQYKDPRWQKKRLEILQRDNFTCIMCNDSESLLHVHHEEYIKNRKPWEYENDKLTTLCEDCHSLAKEIETSQKILYRKKYGDTSFYVAAWPYELTIYIKNKESNEISFIGSIPIQKLDDITTYIINWNMAVFKDIKK